MDSPKISICIPTYNYAEYVTFAIDSVLDQTFNDFEIIIQDDHSSDNTCEVVQRYLGDERISLEINEYNLGLAGNWNRCLSKAKGEYIKFVFADDMLASPDALGTMVSILDSDPSISIVGCSRNIIDSTLQLLRIHSEFSEDFLVDGRKLIHHCLFKERNLIGEPTVVMFRRADCTRGFNGNYKHLIDMEMWFHLLEKGRFAFVNEPLVSFRVHSRQKTNENVKNLVHIDEFHRLLEDYLKKSYIRTNRVAKYYWKYNAIYQFWKAARKGMIGRSEALRKINAMMPSIKFLLILPVYKIIKPIIKLLVKIELIGSFKYDAPLFVNKK